MHGMLSCLCDRARRAVRGPALVATVSLALIVCGACAGTAPPNTQPTMNGDVIVAVTNDGYSDAEIYALRQGTRYHIGFVASNRTAQLHVPAGALEASGELQLVVHRVGDSGADYVAETVHLEPDQLAAFEIAPRVELSTLSVRGR